MNKIKNLIYRYWIMFHARINRKHINTIIAYIRPTITPNHSATDIYTTITNNETIMTILNTTCAKLTTTGHIFWAHTAAQHTINHSYTLPILSKTPHTTTESDTNILTGYLTRQQPGTPLRTAASMRYLRISHRKNTPTDNTRLLLAYLIPTMQHPTNTFMYQ